MIRFRLFSDPYSTGWGWIIDNVNIQKDGSGIFNKISDPEGKLTVSPNPAADHVNLYLNDLRIGALTVKIYDINGTLLFSKEYDKYQQRWHQRISINDWGKGVKIVNVIIGDDIYSQRILIGSSRR